MSPKPQHVSINKVIGLACSIVLSAASLQAADRFWSGSTGDYTNPTWTGGVVPGATDNAINDHGIGNAVQISVGNPDWIVGQIRAGNSLGNGAFVQNGQTVTALGTNYNGSVISEFFTPVRLGIVAADSGVYTLNGGTLNYGNGPFNVGEVGTGTLNLNGGNIVGNGIFYVNSGGVAVPNPAVVTGTAGHGPYLGDYTYYEQGYSATHPTTGLPPAGSTNVSVTQGDHSYKFAPSYTANNAFILDTAVPSATITLATPGVCSGLSFEASAGNGPVVLNYTVNYASGAPDTGTISVADWFGTGQEVLNVEGRVDATGLNFQYPGVAGGNSGNAPYLFSTDISLVNTAPVVSINLTYVSGGGTFATATILAVSGQDIVGNPFTPLTITGYNSDVVIEATAPSPRVSTSVMDTVTQTGGTNTINNQLFVAQGSTAHGTYNLSNGEVDIANWAVIGRNGGNGVFNMTGGTINKTGGGNFIVGSASGDNSLAGTIGTFNQSGGTINSVNEYWIAENALTVATNNISGNAVLNLHNWMSIGRGGLGVLNISGNATINNDAQNWQTGDGGNAIVNQSGGTVSVSGELHVALNSGKFATYNMSGGVLNAHNWFQVGRGGAALLNFTGGTINKDNGGAFIIGDNATDSARVIQTGAGTTFNCANDYWIGNNTTGELDLTNGVMVTQTLSDGNNGTGIFEQSGGSVTVNGELWVGQGGTGNGTYNLSGGGTIVVHNWASIGRNGGTGTVNLESGSISKVDGGAFSIGGDGGANGTLNQSAGGSLSVIASDATYLGQGGGHGTWNMNGGSANLGLLQFCEAGNGSGDLNLNAGVLRATEVNSGSNGLPTTSTFNFNGGTLQAGSDNANFFHDITTVNMNTDVIIDSQGYNVLAVQNLPNGGGVGTSGLVKNGSGTLTLAGTNTYAGATTVNSGILGATTMALTTSSGFSVANGGLGIQVVGALNSQFTMTNVSLAVSANTLNVDLGSFGNPSVAPLHIAGAFANNGTITVNIADAAPALGQIPLVKYDGTMTGSGSFTVGSLPTGVSGYISNNILNKSIDLVISGLNQPRWDGQAGGTWDTGSDTNWVNIGTGLPTFYTDPSLVLFDDSAMGTTTVTLPGTVNPLGVTVNNTNLAYTFTGPGKISGSHGITKTGPNVLTITTTNNYTGPTVVANGTLNVAKLTDFGSPSPIGAAGSSPTNLVFAGGTLNYSGPALTLNRPYTTAAGTQPGGLSSVNNITLTGLVRGNGGEFQKQGPSQLAYVAAGSNDLTGYLVTGSTYRIKGGSVLLDGSAGQTNYIRNLLMGADAGVNTAMTLSNTVLWVRNTLVVGQTNAIATMTLTNSTLNFEGQGGAFTVGDAGGTPVTGVFNQTNSTVNMNGNQWFVGNSASANATYNLNSGAINVHDWVVIGRNGATGTLNMTGGTINHTNTGSAFIISSANNSVGTLNQSGGTINATGGGGYWLSEHPGDIATNNLSGTAVVNVSYDFIIGDGGLGVLNLTGGAIINKFNPDNGKRFYVGKNNNGGGGPGVLNQGPGTQLNITSDLDIGTGGSADGTYNQNGGTANVHGWFTIGRGGNGGVGVYNLSSGQMDAYGEFHVAEGGNVGTVNISGDAVLNAHNWFQIGRNGTATLNMSSGTIHHFNNGGMVLVDGGPDSCTINQTGGFITSDGGDWLIGNGNGLGTWNQSSGTNLSLGGNTFIGSGPGGADYNLSGDASLTINGWLPIGANGPGTLNISGNASLTKNGNSGNHISIGDAGGAGAQGVINQTGGTITSLLSDTYLGAQPTSTGTWNLGPGTAVLSDLRFVRDAGSTGIMNLLAGGTLIVGEINTNGPIGTGSSTFHFNGGKLVARATDATFMQGLTLADIQTGGATIDSAGHDITINQALLDGTGGGGLTKVGNGTLRLNGVNTYTGPTTVSAGTLGGSGTFVSAVTVASGASFSPGASVGTMTINSTLTLAAGSTTVMEVNKTANTSDLVTGTGNTINYGGTLVMKNLSGTLQVGDTFTLFTAATRSGSFSSVVSQTPNQSVTWDVSQLAVNGTVKVASAVAAPVALSSVVSGGKLNFTWPASQIGWQLQHQINPLTVGIYTNWVPVVGSTTTNAVSVPVDSNEATEFYRLAFPAQ